MLTEALLLGLNLPAGEAPEMDIQFSTLNGDLPLLEALAPAVGSLTGDVVLQTGQLLRLQPTLHPAFRHGPELPGSVLHGEDRGAHLLVFLLLFLKNTVE